MPRRNEAVGHLLENIARLLTLKRDDPFRIRAYTEAARVIEELDEDIEELYRSGRLDQVPNVGESIAAKVAEYLETGRSSYLEQLKHEASPEAAELLDVPSIGPGRARLLHDRLGITSVSELELAAREHRLRALPGFGEALERKIAQEAASLPRRSG